MATTKVSALTELTSPDGAEELLINDGGTSKKITITNVSKLNLKGGDLTSADPLVIDTDGNYFDVTGTTGFSAMTVAVDRQFTLQFDAALTMTHHATNLDLPGEANITTAVGDVATFQSTVANQVQCISYTRADGTAVVGVSLDGAVTINDTGADVDFRVESDTNTHALFVQGSDGNVGIGTSSPESELSVDGAVSISSDASIVAPAGFDLKIRSDTSKIGIHAIASSGKPALEFGNGASGYASIMSTGNVPLHFSTNSSGTPGNNIRMSILGNGNVGIGTDSPNVPLTVNGGTNAVVLGLQGRASDDFGIISFYTNDGGTVKGQIKCNASDDMIFRTGASTDRMTIDSNGIVTIDQDTDNEALIIDSESTSDWATKINAKYGLWLEQDISSGRAAYITRNIAEAGSYPLVNITDDHTSNTQPALFIQQNGAGKGIEIDQSGNSNGLYVDSEATSAQAIKSRGKLALGCTQDISGGYAAHFDRNIAETGTYPLVNIKEDNASNTQPTLFIQQNGAGYGIEIDQNGNKSAIWVDSESTAQNVIQIEADALTTGRGLYVYSNSGSTGTRNLVEIHNDHADATGTTALYVNQDSTGAAAVFEGGNVGIGTGDPQQLLHIHDSSGDWGAEAVLTGRLSAGAPKAEVAFKRGTSGDGAMLVLRPSDSSGDLIDAVTIKDGTGDVQVEAGNLIIGTAGKGIMFHPHDETVSTPGSDSNLLDDYEKGTCTMTCNGASNYSGTDATYVKVGNMCTVAWYSGSMTSTVVQAYIDGLPFAALSEGQVHHTFAMSHNNWAPSATSGYVAGGQTRMYLVNVGSVSVPNAVSGTTYVMFSITYRTA